MRRCILSNTLAIDYSNDNIEYELKYTDYYDNNTVTTKTSEWTFVDEIHEDYVLREIQFGSNIIGLILRYDNYKDDLRRVGLVLKNVQIFIKDHKGKELIEAFVGGVRSTIDQRNFKCMLIESDNRKYVTNIIPPSEYDFRPISGIYFRLEYTTKDYSSEFLRSLAKLFSMIIDFDKTILLKLNNIYPTILSETSFHPPLRSNVWSEEKIKLSDDRSFVSLHINFTDKFVPYHIAIILTKSHNSPVEMKSYINLLKLFYIVRDNLLSGKISNTFFL